MKARSVVLLLALSFCSPPSTAQTPAGHGGRSDVLVPDATDAGSWDGTWSYNSAGMKMALWLRTRGGKTEAKLKYESGSSPIVFETDWNGDASYYYSGKASTFAMHVTRSDAARTDGTWSWEMPIGSTLRTEKGDFTLFRTVDGRLLVFQFKTFELTTVRHGMPTRSTVTPVWTFRKVSKREALWDEIPF